MRRAHPDEVKTQVAPAKAEPAAEPAKATPVKMEPEFVTVSPDSPNLGTSKVEAAKPVAKKVSSSSSTSSAKPADKPAAKAEPKDDKPVPAKVDKETKTASKKYKSPGITDLTGTGTSDEERSDNVSKLLKGVKSIFSGPADYITKGSPKMRAKDALKSGMASKDRDAMRKGGSVKKMAGGGKVKSASARADGCAIRGKTRA
jgi:hypothetical protein